MATGPLSVASLGRVPTPLDDFEAFAGEIAAMASRGPDAGSIALSITGVIDPATGLIKAANIPCIDGRPLA
ncbi:MAG TPA: ROK family protein, partial [Rubellimicrobium sp.]|nr:ROK family protein [Rubellimicrobium sp.]